MSRPISLLLLRAWLVSVPGLSTVGAEQFAAGTGYCQQISKSDDPIDLRNIFKEIHIRQNVPGEVKIRDSGRADGRISLTVKKGAATKNDIRGFTTARRVYDTARGQVWVLQVDYHWKPPTVSFKVIVGCVIAFITFCVLIGLCAWCCITRKRRADFRLIRERNRQIHYQGSRDMDRLPAPPSHQRCEPRQHRNIQQGHVDVNRSSESLEIPAVTVTSPRIAGPIDHKNRVQANHSPTKQHHRGNNVSAVRGGGGSRGAPKSTLMAVSIVAVISVVYANCSMPPWADVIITLPTNSKLDAVRVFGNKDRKITLNAGSYMHGNISKLTFQVFDVTDETPTDAEPCFAADHNCEGAENQRLAGCNPVTKKCMCQRGYELEGNICWDIDECARGLFSCPGGSTCKNQFGSYVCECAPHYYLNDGQCTECSFTCPVGHYEAKPCTIDRDRVCEPCTVCGGASYEAGPCNGLSNSHCLHVAYPLLVKDQDSEPAYREGMKVETSDNVFSEDLHNTGNLDTTQYITDKKQTADFYWDRESGLRVNIGVDNISLVPEFEDVDHESDTLFMKRDKKNTPTKSRLIQLTNDFCRHPLPDYYSISLEIARDRTTAAHEILCDSKNPKITKCPDQYRDGDTYILRTLNEACVPMGTFPQELSTSESNNLICTENSDLLSKYFNQSYAEEKLITIPPGKCKKPVDKCKQCLSQKRCSKDPLEASCCKIDCYVGADCKKSVSPPCSQVPKICAMGDAYTFMILPVFNKLQQEFQCHLRYKKPSRLYTLFFEVTIKDQSFMLPRVSRDIYNKGIDFQNHALYKQDYVTIEHNTGMLMNEDVIIRGRTEAGQTSHVNYTVYPLKQPHEFGTEKPVVNMFSTKVFTSKTQFESPFAYSTESWQKDGGCDKNITKFRKLQPMYRDQPQSVSVKIEKTDKGGFNYQLKSLARQPNIHFSVPGNFSVLYWYFKNNGPVLYANDTLVSQLERSPNGKIWTISLSARMSDVPAYLGIIINDRTTQEELFKYDLLIRKTPEFSISFKVPNFGLDKERVFEVLLQDSMRLHTVYLNHLDIPESEMKSRPLAAATTEPVPNSWTSVGVIASFAVSMLLLCLVAYLYVDCTKPKSAKFMEEVVEVHKAVSQTHNSPKCCYPQKNINHGQFVFVILYAVFRVLYSLVFTFSVTMAIALLVVHEDLVKLSTLSEFQIQKKNDTLEKAREIDNYREMETLRQIKLATRMQSACNHYIQDVFISMKDEMHNITWKNQVNMFDSTTSVTAYIQDLVNDALGRYRQELSNFTMDYREKFDKSVMPVLVRYKKFLNEMYNNGWFNFPKKLYNSTNYNKGRPEDLLHSDYLNGEAVNFLSFLELKEVEAVQLMPLKFWKRYYSKQPSVKDITIGNIRLNFPGCEFIESVRSFTDKNAYKSKLNTFRFFPLDPDSATTRSLFRDEGFMDLKDYGYILPIDGITNEDSLLLHLEEVFESLDLKVLLYFFLLLDAMVLLYRCTNTYATIQTLYRGFEEKLSLTRASIQKQYEQKVKMPPPMTKITNQNNKMDTKNLLPRDRSESEAKDVPLIDKSDVGHHKHKTIHQKTFSNHRKTCVMYLFRLIRTKVIVVILAACLMGVVSYIVVNLTSYLLTVESLYQYGGLGTFLGGLDVRLEHTNSFVKQQAEHLNSVTIEIYKQQMRAELQSLQSMMEHFNLEQEDVVASYVAEICAVQVKLLGEYAKCELHIAPTKLELQLLPCNFIPIDAYPYTGYDRAVYISHLRNDFVPFTTAAQNVVLKTLYVVMVNIICMYLLHLGGLIVFHFLKTRHKFPVHRVYMSVLPPSDCELRLPTETDSDEAGFHDDPKIRKNKRSKKSPETLSSSGGGFSETKV